MVEATSAQQQILDAHISDYPTGGVVVGGERVYGPNDLERLQNNIRDYLQVQQLRDTGQRHDTPLPASQQGQVVNGQFYQGTAPKEAYGANGPSGIRYSQPGSITGGGIVTSTGTQEGSVLRTDRANAPGVYQALGGQFPAGTQVTITEGPKGNTAGEYIKQLSKGPYTPGRIIDSRPYGVNNINYITNANSDGNQSRSISKDNRSSVLGISSSSLDNYKKEIEAQKQRDINFQQSEGFKRIDALSSFLTGGGGIPKDQRGFVGRYSQSLLDLGLGSAIGLGGAIASGGEKIYLTGKGLLIPETRGNVVPVLFENIKPTIGQIGSSVNPTTPEGLAGLTFTVLGVAGSKGSFKSEGDIVVSPRSGASAVTRVTENTLSSTQNLLGVAKVEGERVPVQTKVLLTGERVPNTDFFTTRVETVSAIPTSKGTQFLTQDFVGPLNTRNSLLSLTNREGTKFFFTQTGRGETAMFDTVSSIEKNPSRFINLGTEPGSVIPIVRNTGEANILSETNAYSKIPYKGVEGVNFFGVPKTETFIESNTGYLNKGGGGANPDLFKGGFQNLQRAGLYNDPVIVQGKGLSILASRRGSIGETISPGAYRPLEGMPITAFPKGTSVSKAPSPLDLSGLEITGRITTTKTASVPTIPLLETPANNSTEILSPTISTDTTLSSTTQKKDTTIISGPDTIFVPGTSTGTSTLLDTSTTQLSGTTQTTSPATTTSTTTSQVASQDTGQSQSFRQSLNFEQQYLTKSQTGQDTILKSNAGFFNEPTGKIKEENQLDLGTRRTSKKNYSGSGGRRVQAYNVLLKRKGNFEVLGRGLTRNEALLKGEKAALGDLAATFKLVKDGTTTERNVQRPGDLNKYFRDYKIVKGRPVRLVDTYIQKRGQRLVTTQERSQLQAARQQRATHDFLGKQREQPAPKKKRISWL